MVVYGRSAGVDVQYMCQCLQVSSVLEDEEILTRTVCTDIFIESANETVPQIQRSRALLCQCNVVIFTLEKKLL